MRIVRIFFLPPRKWASGLCRTTAYAIVFEARIAQPMDFTRRLAAVRRARPARRFLPHTRPKEHPSMERHRPNVMELASRDRPAAHWTTVQPAGSTSFAAICISLFPQRARRQAFHRIQPDPSVHHMAPLTPRPSPQSKTEHTLVGK